MKVIKLKKVLQAKKELLLFTLIVSLFLFFRLPGLGTDIANSDALRWHLRTTRFLDALKSGGFRNTYQMYHPGVTIMWSNSLVKQSIQFYDFHYSENPGQITVENSAFFPLIHKYSKIFQVFILAALFCFQLYLIRSIYSLKVSILYGFLASLEPYSIGIDRWFHLTSFETYFSFSSFLLILFWRHTIGSRFSKYYFFISSLFLALAILSKVTALVVLPIVVFIIYNTIREKSSYKFSRFIMVSGIYIALTLTLIFLLFPAFWVAPIYVLSKISEGITGGIYEDMRLNPLPYYYQHFYYLVVLFMKLSPITLVLAFFSAFSLFKGMKHRNYLAVYLFVYFIALSVSTKKIDRYVIALIPTILLFTAYFLAKYKGKILYIALTLISIFAIYVNWTFYPVYSAYYSPLLGKTPSGRALELGFYDNSGEYYAQAAGTLNNIISDQKVWVPYGRDSFNAYFKRDTLHEYSSDVTFAVTSLDHLNELQQTCPEITHTFGSKKESIVFILNCGNSRL